MGTRITAATVSCLPCFVLAVLNLPCLVWSNFEIGDLDFWRGEAYSKFFDYLDAKGGFYYERWGDAPVHSIGAALFAHKDQIHFFNDIGYRHEPFQHCPQGEAHSRGKCWCSEKENFGEHWPLCLFRLPLIPELDRVIYLMPSSRL